jgi:hypothetical protein
MSVWAENIICYCVLFVYIYFIIIVVIVVVITNTHSSPVKIVSIRISLEWMFVCPRGKDMEIASWYLNTFSLPTHTHTHTRMKWCWRSMKEWKRKINTTRQQLDPSSAYLFGKWKKNKKIFIVVPKKIHFYVKITTQG